MSNEVVAHYMDGHLVKGTSFNINPAKPQCHIRTLEEKVAEVALSDLKALYFVRSFEGDATYQEGSHIDPEDPRRIGAHSIEVRFQDGERLVALTTHFPPARQFFFVLPADRRSNNERVLVNQAACVDVRSLPSEPLAS